MLDSMLSVMIFTLVVTILMPAVLMLEQIDNASSEQLKVHRQLYLEISRYESYDQFLKKNTKYKVKSGEICENSNLQNCFKTK